MCLLLKLMNKEHKKILCLYMWHHRGTFRWLIKVFAIYKKLRHFKRLEGHETLILNIFLLPAYEKFFENPYFNFIYYMEIMENNLNIL